MQPVSRLRRAAIAVAVLWFVNGLTTATIGARLPAILDKAHLDKGEVGLALAGQSIGLIIVVLAAAPPLIRRFGARPVAVASGVLYCASTALPGLPTSLWLLFVAFLAVGAFNAPLDVAMADLGGAVEKARGKPTMSSFEALFVVGQVAGALIGLICTAVVPIEVGLHLALVAGAAVVLVLVAWPALPARGEQEEEEEEQQSAGRVVTRRSLLLAAIAFASLWCEGAVVDWSALLFRDELGAGGLSVVGLICFVTAVLIALLLGNGLSERWGSATVTRVGGALFAAGMLLTLFSPSIWLASVGLAVAGLGLPNAHPYALSVARGLGGAKTLAFVQGMSYIGLVAAKPAIGTIAEAGSLRLALGSTVVLALLMALGASALREPKRDAPTAA
jgi:predicted MFS family arabinose efflux permease